MIKDLYTKALEKVNSFEYQRGISKKLSDEADKYSDILNKFPKGDMGLVPDEVTKTDEYKKALSDYKKAFKKERDFNAVYSKKFKKEIRKRVQEDRDKKTKAYREKERRTPPTGYLRGHNVLSNGIVYTKLFKESLAKHTLEKEGVGKVSIFIKQGNYYIFVHHDNSYSWGGYTKDKTLDETIKAVENVDARVFNSLEKIDKPPYKKIISKATIIALKKMSKNLNGKIYEKDKNTTLMTIKNGIATFSNGESTVVSKIKFDAPNIQGMRVSDLRSIADEMYFFENGKFSAGEEWVETDLDFSESNPKTSINTDIKIPITKEFITSLQMANKAVDANNPKFELNGLLIDVEDGKGKAVGTDTRRLAISKEFKVSGKDGQYIILPNHITEDTKSIEIDTENVMAKSETDEFIIYARNINGGYPDYKRIIPQHPKNSFTFNSKDLVKVIKKAKEVFLDVDGSELVIYELIAGEVQVSSETVKYSDAGEKLGSIKIDATDIQTDERIALNARYIIDAIDGTKEAKLSYSVPLLPITIEANETLTIVMPINVISKEDAINERIKKQKERAKHKSEREAKKLKDEEDYQSKLKEEEGIADEFLNTLTPQRRGSAKKTLEKPIRVDGVVKSQKDFIYELVAKGFAPKFSEWTEWSRRKGEEVKKSSWKLDGYSITKTEADFAKYLIENNVQQDSINSIETEDKHITIGELDITIETQAGTIRSGTDENGKDWSNEMIDDYGYFNGTHGNDGDEIDVFVSSDVDTKDIPSMPVFYLKQNHKDGTFDEDKFILGAGTQKEAEKVYYRNYESGYKNSGSWHKISFGKLQGTLKKLSKIYISKSK